MFIRRYRQSLSMILFITITSACKTSIPNSVGKYVSIATDTLVINPDSTFTFDEKLSQGKHRKIDGQVAYQANHHLQFNSWMHDEYKVNNRAQLNLDSLSKKSHLKILLANSDTLIPIASIIGYKSGVKPDTVVVLDGWLNTLGDESLRYDSVAINTFYYKDFVFKPNGNTGGSYTVRFYPDERLNLLSSNFYRFKGNKYLLPKLRSKGRDRYSFKRIK